MPSYQALMRLHLWTVVPAFALGTVLLVLRKGSPLHKGLGKLYMALMLFTGLVTLAMPAHVGPRLLGHFGALHAFSALTLWSVPRAWYAARQHRMVSHRNAMIGLYVGGLLIAGGLALAPGRYLHAVLFGS